MTLKSFRKINLETKTNYVVRNTDNEYEYTILDYTASQKEFVDALKKVESWESKGAKISSISVFNGTLEVSCIVK